jgi:dTDP-4-dehydrorhamnose 3,5-epimerase
MLFVPERCGHGYQTLENDTELFYLTSQYYTASAARGVRFNDPAFNIQWPLRPAAMSEQDVSWPLLATHEARSADLRE